MSDILILVFSRSIIDDSDDSRSKTDESGASMMTVNDAPNCGVTDDFRSVIYYHNVFIIQAKGGIQLVRYWFITAFRFFNKMTLTKELVWQLHYLEIVDIRSLTKIGKFSKTIYL